MATTPLNDNIRIEAPKPIDDRQYSTQSLMPHNSKEEMNAAIDPSVRYPGLFGYVSSSSEQLTRYWYYGGTADENLVPENANDQGKEEKSTGFVTGLELSINVADSSSFDIEAGYFIITTYTDKTNPLVELKYYEGSSANISSYLLTSNATYIALDSDGNIIQSSSPFNNSDRRAICLVGILNHPNRTFIESVSETKAPILASTNQMHDIIEAVGPLNITGNVYNYSGSVGLRMTKTAGKIFGLGINANQYEDPHSIGLTAQNNLSWRYRLQDGTEFSDTDVIDPNNYDDNGSLTTVPAGKFTIQRVNLFQNNTTRIQYGQAVYDTMNDARLLLQTEPFIKEPNIAEDSIFRSYIIIKEGITDLSSSIAADSASFIPVDKFGNLLGNAGVSITYSTLIDALGFVPENSDNKVQTLSGSNVVTYPSTQAIRNAFLNGIEALTGSYDGNIGLGGNIVKNTKIDTNNFNLDIAGSGSFSIYGQTLRFQFNIDKYIQSVTDRNSFQRLEMTNLNSGGNAGMGLFFVNNGSTGLQLYKGSTNNFFGSSSAVIRNTGAGNMRFGTDTGFLYIHAGKPFLAAIEDRWNVRMDSASVAINDRVFFTKYGSGSYSGSASRILGVSSSGQVVEFPTDAIILSGSFNVYSSSISSSLTIINQKLENFPQIITITTQSLGGFDGPFVNLSQYAGFYITAIEATSHQNNNSIYLNLRSIYPELDRLYLFAQTGIASGSTVSAEFGMPLRIPMDDSTFRVYPHASGITTYKIIVSDFSQYNVDNVNSNWNFGTKQIIYNNNGTEFQLSNLKSGSGYALIDVYNNQSVAGSDYDLFFKTTGQVKSGNINIMAGYNQYVNTPMLTGSNGVNIHSHTRGGVRIYNGPTQSILITGSNVIIGTGSTGFEKLQVHGNMRVTSLSGSGFRMVVADATGSLTTQIIPTNSTSSLTINNNGVFRLLASNGSTSSIDAQTNLVYSESLFSVYGSLRVSNLLSQSSGLVRVSESGEFYVQQIPTSSNAAFILTYDTGSNIYARTDFSLDFINSTNIQNININITASNNTIYLVDTSTSSRIIWLNTLEMFSGGRTQKITINKITNDFNPIEVRPTSGSINGSSVFNIIEYNESKTFISNGSNIYII